MAPNHDSHVIQDTSKAQRKIKTNAPVNNLPEAHHSSTDQQGLFARTLFIVQYVIHCLARRNSHQNPTPVAKKVRELTSDIVEKHDVYNSLCVNLGFTPENLQDNFNAVAANIFEDGLINWGRLVALLGFSVKVTEYFRYRGFGDTYDEVVVELTTQFIVSHTGEWIQSRGGWVSITILAYIKIVIVRNVDLSETKLGQNRLLGKGRHYRELQEEEEYKAILLICAFLTTHFIYRPKFGTVSICLCQVKNRGH